MIAGTLPTRMRPLSQERLVAEAQAFSQEAWAQIHDEYYAKIFEYCYLHTGDRAAAEDLSSEVFLEALRGIRRYEYRGLPISSWLYRIARNLTADFLKSNARRPTVSLADEEEHPRLQSPDATDASLDWHDIRDALGRLTADQRQVIVLRFFHNLSHEETAAVMGRRPGAVRVLQSRALAALRRLMTGEAR